MKKKEPLLKQNADTDLLKAIDFVKAYNKIPKKIGFEKAILCFSPFTAKKLKSRYEAQSFFHLGACWDYYPQHKTVIVSQFGVGAPAGILQLEYLKAFRVLNFGDGYKNSTNKRDNIGNTNTTENKKPFLVFSLGSASCLHKKFDLGQAVEIDQAFYAEKDLLHYRLKPPERQDNLGDYNPVVKSVSFRKNQVNCKKAGYNPAVKSAGFGKQDDVMLRSLTKKLGLKVATAVTCDIPYKIQKEDVQFWKSQGAEVLEMETAGLISAGQELHVPVFCLCVVSDFLDEKEGWNKGFSNKVVHNNLLALLEKILFV